MNFSAMLETAKFASETARPVGPCRFCASRRVEPVEHHRAEPDDRGEDVQHEQDLEQARESTFQCQHVQLPGLGCRDSSTRGAGSAGLTPTAPG